MEIKWHDKSQGSVKTERWTRISSSKAMEMLRRKAPDIVPSLQRELNLGREVVMDGYTLRDETARKAEFMQGLDDDDYNTVTFYGVDQGGVDRTEMVVMRKVGTTPESRQWLEWVNALMALQVKP